MTREEYAAKRASAVPMAYKGSAMDVAYAALYFASDESRYVSGAWLPVDGALAAS
jgi:3(or 17)beta-hydroxysteroid dehydrogenase